MKTSLAYRVVTPTIKCLTRILCRVDDAELARVPERGPLIVVVNHVNFLDVPLLFTHLQPRPVTGFAKAETWDNPALRVLVDLWGAIPLRRGEADMTAIRQGLDLLKSGHVLVIAPEGTRSGDGCLQRGRPGVVLLALRSGAPVLPMAYYGAERLWHNVARLRRTDYHIRVGRPFYLDTGGARVTRHVRQQIVDEIMVQMAALLPPAYRGYYADLTATTNTYLRLLPRTTSEAHPARN